MLFSKFYTKITTFFDQEKFGTAPLLYADVEMFGGKCLEITSRHKNDVKIVIMTSYTRVVLQTPCRTTFPSPGCIHPNPGQVCKNQTYGLGSSVSRVSALGNGRSWV